MAALYSDDKYEIRPAKHNDEFREMWWQFMQELGWNRCYHDLDSYMGPSKSVGMILLIEKSTGKPCGHVSAVVNQNSTGWVSMFIIDAHHRGQGLGRPLFQAAMDEFERNGTRIQGLDAVPEQKGTYERRGFVDSPLGMIKIMMRPLVVKEPLSNLEISAQSPGSLVEIRKVPRQLLVQHELKYTGFERDQLWTDGHMFGRPDVTGCALVKVDTPRSVNDLMAWALVRRCSEGLRIGPVYADDVASAKLVLIAAMKFGTPEIIKRVPLPKVSLSDLSENEIAQKATLVAEVWGGNPEAVKAFEELGWKYVGAQYHRMWVDNKATTEFSEGGQAQNGVFAIFDAAVG